MICHHQGESNFLDYWTKIQWPVNFFEVRNDRRTCPVPLHAFESGLLEIQNADFLNRSIKTDFTAFAQGAGGGVEGRVWIKSIFSFPARFPRRQSGWVVGLINFCKFFFIIEGLNFRNPSDFGLVLLSGFGHFVENY